MSIGEWIIDRLPSSKRAVRQNRDEIDALRRENAALSERLGRIEGMVAGLDPRLADVAGRLGGIEAGLRGIAEQGARSEVLEWSLYRREGEGDAAARRRLFSEMPAVGDLSRLLQLGCDQLLADFDEICAREGLSYWALSGTLLGAVRHGGFIPWDDDPDLGMMRDDIRALGSACAGTAFEVSVQLDPVGVCRQVRFRRRDAQNPCFIDLFIHDWSALDADAAYDARCERREAFDRALFADPKLADARAAWDPHAVEQDPAEGAWLAGLFDRAVEDLLEAGAIGPREGARSIVWSVDDLGGRFAYPAAFPVADVFPCTRLPFGYGSVLVPAAGPEILHRIYGDYLQLPGDIKTHFRHVDDRALRRGEVQEAIAATLSPERRAEFDGVLASWNEAGAR